MSAQNGACDRAGCTARAFGRVSVLVFPQGDVKRTRGAKLTTELLVCGKCAATLRPRDVISDEGWTEICRTFVAEGRMPPRRESAQVLVQPVPTLRAPLAVARRTDHGEQLGAGVVIPAALVPPLPRRFAGPRR